MASKGAVPTPLNSVWAVDTPNKLNLSDDDTNQGIIYQSMVVSNQVNGALYKMSEAIRHHQLAGGYYVPGQRYFRGQIIRLSVTEDVRYPPTVRFYECINDNNSNGIVDILPYRVVQATTDFGGVRNYVVNPADANTTYWRMLNGNEDLLKDWVNARIDETKAWVTSEIKKLENKVNKQLAEQQARIDKQIRDQQTWVDNRIKSIEDRWKVLPNITGGTFNFNFAGDNNDYNCFVLNITGRVNFGTVSWAGAKERSGCFLIQTGALHIQQFFTNDYHSFSVNPFFPQPVGSNGQQKIWMFYKVHPTYGVCFTRG